MVEEKLTITCTNCGATHHGKYRTGFWTKWKDNWYHWCSGGRPGSWMRAELKGEADELSEVRQPEGSEATAV